MTIFVAQLRSELRVMARNGEQLLLIVVIPLALLLFFGSIDILPTGSRDPVEFLVPGILALAIMSTAMVSLGIATGFERQYLVLKRLGATPLGRPRLVLAKTAAVALIEILQLVAIVGVAAALGWRPANTAWLVLCAASVLGTFAFAGLGLTLAGRLRAEVNLAAQNGLYLFLLLSGGMIIDSSSLPEPLANAARVLPASALTDLLRSATGDGSVGAGTAWVVLGTWAVVAPLVAARTFRWQ
jgi:ABC-2 type transport system permease protein